ncbi:hypothetical protein ACFL5T_04165 [Gemmatimonadota bacterium]
MKILRLFPIMLFVSVTAPVLPSAPSSDLMAQAPMHNCSFCHSLHGGTYSLTEYAIIEDLCISCHGEAGPATVDRDGVQVAVPKSGRNDDGNTFVAHNGSKHTAATNCWDCHNHEGEASLNFKMVQAIMPTPSSGDKDVVLTAWTGTNSFADGDATYDGVCEVCHTATDYHKNIGPPGSHNFTDDCTACHLHGSGFAGAGGGCAGCHSSTQGTRRIIVSEFDRTTHHVDWAGGGLANSGEIPDSDCTTCHDQSAHQAGNVRLWDVDDPGNTAASTVLTGDPNSSSTEAAKLESFCLTCHDADGANGNTTPFTGGATVPPIDATAWAASSHEGSASLAGCYGNGMFGCHASGHGSEKLNMLTPANAAATAPAYAEEEEGFCFNCHDSDGPAGSDVDSVYGEPVLWVTAAVGANDNTELNNRHEVEYAVQATSGAKIECTDCHDPHRATAAQPWKTDPDPTDGRIPGTGQVFAGTDALSEFCMDCHDGSFPSTVTAPTTALDDIRTTWATDAMGGAGGSPAIRSGYGWGLDQVLPCLACHTPHTSSNLFHAVPVVMSQDGTTPVPSDGGAGYEFTNNNIRDVTINGYDWCNTCHTGSMGGKKADCFGCHYHGSRW